MQAGVEPEKISMFRDTYYFHIVGQESGARSSSCSGGVYGPTMNAFEAAEQNGKAEELHGQLLELAERQNRSSNGGTLIPATFLRVTVAV